MSLKTLAIGTLGALRRPWAKHNLQKELKARQDRPIFLEIGAFTTRRPNWIATDISWRCTNYLNVEHEWPIANNSIEAVFSDNVVEHLPLSTNRFFFREAMRVLRPGGRIRTVTPDVQALASAYARGWLGNEALRQELVDEGYTMEHPVDLLRFVFQDDGHHLGYLWDEESLEQELSAAGFVQIERFALGDSNSSELLGIDERLDLPIADVMLVVEAVKPSP